MRRTVERELKLTPTDSFRLADLEGVQLPSRDFVSTYFDTPELSLARAGITLRHRSEGGSRLWQLKIPHGAARIELEVAGPPARPPEELVALLAVHLRGTQPARVARLRTRRKTLRADGAEISEDAVSVLDGQQVRARFRELEVELLEGGDESTLRRIEKTLLRAGAEPAEFRPKLLQALDVDLPITHARSTAKASPHEAIAVALVEQHDRLVAHDPGTRLGTDAEDLHQMRVAARRARAYLRAAGPVLDSDWADELRTELGWLGSALGPVRDLDVLVERMQSEVSRLGDHAAAAQGLLRSIERKRRKARAAALSALSEGRYLALLDRLEDPHPLSSPDGGTASLGSLWWTEFGRTKRRLGKLDEDSRDDELHAARISVKRARYAAELAEHELGVAGERFVEAAKRLQDILGEHQDAVVAEEHVRAWAARRPEGEAAARKLVKRERARRKKARSEWRDAWKLLERRARKARP